MHLVFVLINHVPLSVAFLETGKYYRQIGESIRDIQPLSPRAHVMERNLAGRSYQALREVDLRKHRIQPQNLRVEFNILYVITLGVFHQVHCVNHLRQALYILGRVS